jgi:hypothetical protein
VYNGPLPRHPEDPFLPPAGSINPLVASYGPEAHIVTTNLRLSLTILSIGFAIEGGSELYSVASKGSFHPSANLLFLVPAVATLLGLLFVWVGRHEWSETHRDRVRQAHMVFGLSILAGVVAAAVVAVLAYVPALGSPLWAEVLFGAAIGFLVLGTFFTYVYLIFHLVARPSQAVLIASIVWAFLVSTFIGEAMAVNLSSILGLVAHRTLTLPTFLAPVDTLASYLFLSYFLLLAAYVEAHRQIARDPTAASVPNRASPPGRRPELRPYDAGAAAQAAAAAAPDSSPVAESGSRERV